MGKKRRHSVAKLPIKDLHHLDHAVFGNLVIAQQSPVENSRFSKNIFASSEIVDNPRPLSASRPPSLEEINARNTQENLVQPLSEVETFCANQKQLRRSYSYESARQHSSPPVVLRKNPNYTRRSSCCSSPSSLRSSTTTDEEFCSPRRSPVVSRGSSIEEETDTVFSGTDTSSVVSTNEWRECVVRDNDLGKRRVSFLVDELLYDIYERDGGETGTPRRRRNSNSSAHESDGCSVTSVAISRRFEELRVRTAFMENIQRARLDNKGVDELCTVLRALRYHVQYVGALLVKELKRRENQISKRDKQYDVITAFLQAHSEKRSEDTRMRFSAMPHPGDSGFTQWHDAMKMVARLPGGIPPEFRRRLWLTLAEKHLQSRSVDWSHAERFCFNEWMNPDDDELGIQIVKDLHRTGCSLFCGVAGQQNQALLKRVLLAFARWNKGVGYCQGFNMLAAIILQVCDRSETDALKVMIYLIEGVLPESYFANNLRGLSVDMAVFRDLLRLRLPSLSRHLEQLQHDARDTVTGTSYEPPLTNVFTMQWFLTLFSNCLPQSTVLRVWDLIFLEGNEVLLRTALAIWDTLADRIMAVNSADEFYSIMGVLTREMLEFGLMDTNNLIKAVVRLSLPELPDLRDKYLYNITPWSHTVSNAARRGLRLFHSDDEEETDEDDEKMAVAAAYGIFRSPRQRDSAHRDSLSSFPFAPDRERLALDISALKQQYSKLRERQRQAHIILTAACARQPLSNPSTGQVAMNHLLLGKSALMSVRGRRGAPPGAVPPPAIKAAKGRKENKPPPTKQSKVSTSQAESAPSQKVPGETLHWKDAASRKRLRRLSLAGEGFTPAPSEEATPLSPEMEEEPVAEVLAEDPEEDDDGSSSTSTELCDEPDRLSDFDSEEPTSVSEASSYNLVAMTTTDEKARSSPPNIVTISPVYEEGPELKKEFLSPLSEVGSSFELKARGSPSSGETSSYNLASSKTTSGSRSPIDFGSSQVDICTLARNSTETSLMKLDLDDDVTVNDDLDEEIQKVEAKVESDEIDLIQIEEDLDESFESFVVERRKSVTSPVEMEAKDKGSMEEVKSGVEIVLESLNGPEEIESDREIVEEDRDILKELVSQLSLDLTSVSVPASRETPVEEGEPTLPTIVCEMVVEEVETTVISPLGVISDGGEEFTVVISTPGEEISDVCQEVLSGGSGGEDVRDEEMVDVLKEVPEGSQGKDGTDEDTSDVSKEVLGGSGVQDGDRREKETERGGGDLDTDVNYLQGEAKKDEIKTVEYLDVGPKFNIGRRHSERAMQIIHENNLILQNISQLQSRRPSDLSGDVTKRRSMIGLMGIESRLSGEEIPEVDDSRGEEDDERQDLEVEDLQEPPVCVVKKPPLNPTPEDFKESVRKPSLSDDVIESVLNGSSADDLECEVTSQDPLERWTRKSSVDTLLGDASAVAVGGDVESGETDVVNRGDPSSSDEVETMSEICVVSDFKRLVFPPEDVSDVFVKATPVLGGCELKEAFHRAGSPYARSVDVITDAELLSVIDSDRKYDRHVSLSSTDIQSAKPVEESLNPNDPNAYKPYSFHDGSKRRSISLDETDSSKYKQTDEQNFVCKKPERSKIFLPLSLSSVSRGLESKLSPILSKSTEVLSPVIREVDVCGLGMSKSQDDLSPVTFRFKSFPIARTPTRSPGATKSSQRYSWACYENDKIFASGDAKMSPMSPSMSRSESTTNRPLEASSPSFRPYGGVPGGSGEWTFEMTKTALKMKKIFSPLTTPDESAITPLSTSYDFPKHIVDDPVGEVHPKETAPLCDRNPLGDAPKDDSPPDEGSFSRLATFKPKDFSSNTSYDKVTFDPSTSRYSPYTFPKTDLETLGLEPSARNGNHRSDPTASYRLPTSSFETESTSPGHVTVKFPGFPKSPIKSPTKTFDPFPTRVSERTKPREVAVKLGLYATPNEGCKNKSDPENS